MILPFNVCTFSKSTYLLGISSGFLKVDKLFLCPLVTIEVSHLLVPIKVCSIRNPEPNEVCSTSNYQTNIDNLTYKTPAVIRSAYCNHDLGNVSVVQHTLPIFQRHYRVPTFTPDKNSKVTSKIYSKLCVNACVTFRNRDVSLAELIKEPVSKTQ